MSHCAWLQTCAWRSGIKKRKACQFMYSHLTPVNSPSPVLWCGIVVTALTVWTTLKVWRQVVMETALRYRVWGRKQSFVSEPRTAWTATAQRAQLLCDTRANEPWQKDPLTQNLNGYKVLVCWTPSATTCRFQRTVFWWVLEFQFWWSWT